ncbi:aminotransferase class IV [Vampirovibrio sp.]|uniref:aminotransferase class IV n=1 Tax=Vampirovibrio sp. TaxID=2717857 RepID=UPI003593BDA9
MHRELFNPQQAEPHAAQSLTDFPEGLLYGYSVYTTLKMPCSEQVIDLHLQRLKKDCKALGLSWRYTDHWIMRQLSDLFQAQTENPVFRLSVCADLDGYGAFYSEEKWLPSRLFLSSRPLGLRPAKGLRLTTVNHQRAMPTLKHGAMADTILRKRQARQQGFDDILLMNEQGHVCEASTANFFLIQNGVLMTSDPLRDGCLPGITRQQLLDGAQSQRIEISTEAISLETIQNGHGAFLSNAVQGVVAVQCVDDYTLPWPTEAQRLMTCLGQTVSI